MPEVKFGPKLEIDIETGRLKELPGVMIDALTVGELFEKYETITGARVMPHEPPKYFLYYPEHGSEKCMLVDVHVVREGESICVKQDLSFSLLPDDKVVLGPLAC